MTGSMLPVGAIDARMLVGYSPWASHSRDVALPLSAARLSALAQGPETMTDPMQHDPNAGSPQRAPAESAAGGPSGGGSGASAEDLALVAALRQGDERAFMLLVERYHMALIHMALAFVASRAVAEEVAQDTWIAVLQGIDRFEGRSSLKTWIFRILSNKAKTRGEREGRIVPFSALASTLDDPEEPAVDPDQFRGDADAYPGHWRAAAASWSDVPEERLLAREARDTINRAIAALPPNQRTVITLRDVEGWDAEEVRELLGISDSNQRVLLHRARSKVRATLDRYLNDEEVQPA